MKRAVVLEIPESIRSALEAAGYSTETLSAEARKQLAAALYQKRVLTLSQAAQLAGMSLWEFIPVLAEQGVPALTYDPEELEHDWKAIQRLSRKMSKQRSRRTFVPDG